MKVVVWISLRTPARPPVALALVTSGEQGIRLLWLQRASENERTRGSITDSSRISDRSPAGGLHSSNRSPGGRRWSPSQRTWRGLLRRTYFLGPKAWQNWCLSRGTAV